MSTPLLPADTKHARRILRRLQVCDITTEREDRVLIRLIRHAEQTAYDQRNARDETDPMPMRLDASGSEVPR